jgi:hypothetical protein
MKSEKRRIDQRQFRSYGNKMLWANVNQAALEAGNLPQMIFRHYRELAMPEQARTWFSIVPDQAANVVSINRAA